MSCPKRNLLNLEPDGYSDKAIEILKRLAVVDRGPLKREELLAQVQNYEVLVVRLGHKIDKELLDRAKKLEVIVSATTGLNHIDSEFAKSKKVDILSLRGETEFLDNVHATSEHTWALLLAVLRNIPNAHRHVLSDGWERDLYKGRELEGKTLGVIGFGRLGKKVAQYGVAFGMRVLACDKRTLSNTFPHVVLKELDELLKESDIISVHVDYTPENKNLIGKPQFQLMKRGVVLINTARGEIINETALVEAYREGILAGVGLDVVSGENTNPMERREFISKFKDASNVVITPHIGGCTYESMEKTEIFMADKLRKYYTKK